LHTNLDREHGGVGIHEREREIGLEDKGLKPKEYKNNVYGWEERLRSTTDWLFSKT